MTELEFLYAELAVCIDTREQANLAENSLGRAISRLDKQRSRIEARIAVLEGQAPTPTPTPTPTPSPTPTPVPLPEPPPVREGELATNTGVWPVEVLAGGYKVGDEVFITRAPDGDGIIDEEMRAYRGVTFSLLPGSVRCVGTPGPTATPERMLKAIADRRILPYSLAAFEGWAKTPTIKAEPEIAYRPDLIYGRSSSNNAIAYTLSGQGGEYGSSRGFLSADDAHLVMGAVDGNEAQFAAAAEDCFSDVLYGLSLPNFAIWSDKNHCLRDPQTPFPGDLPYVNAGTSKTENYGDEGKLTFAAGHPAIEIYDAVAGTAYQHGRDTSHLFNHGYAYWVASGDWRAALLQQAIAAYSLASVWQGAYPDGSTRTQFGYQRWTINMWSAAWKLRDVALHASGPLLWDAERSLRHAHGVIADWKRRIAEMDAATDIYSRASSIFRGIDNGVTADDSAYSNFMIQLYGPETAYLWASAGEGMMLHRIAENMVLRFGRIGGTRGIYGKGTGSAFRLLEGNTLPYDDADGLVRWTNDGNSLPNDSFDGAAQHTVHRAYWALRLAEDAVRRGWCSPVAGLADAISAMEVCRAKKAPNKDLGVVSVKHGGVAFDA